tara:strand:- start:3175 stop:3366 length:192 start_codon:yes stop_codon:yes gene_type:complete
MVHLSNITTISIMVFYSLLTYFIGPQLTLFFMADNPENCVVGFTIGFAISIFLWMKYGKEFAK